MKVIFKDEMTWPWHLTEIHILLKQKREGERKEREREGKKIP